MLAYHGDPAIKAKHVARMRAHQEADELVRGTYWKNGKGCAVGCTIHSDNHAAYETKLGMPEWLACLEEKIFEKASMAVSYQFPLDLLSAIPVGFTEWDRLYHEFCVFLLRDICDFDRTTYPDVASAVDAVICLHERWTETDDQVWSAARSAAWSAGAVARSAKAAADVAESAAQSAIGPAPWSAAEAADSAIGSADSVVEQRAYDRMGNWLLGWFAVWRVGA